GTAPRRPDWRPESGNASVRSAPPAGSVVRWPRFQRLRAFPKPSVGRVQPYMLPAPRHCGLREERRARSFSQGWQGLCSFCAGALVPVTGIVIFLISQKRPDVNVPTGLCLLRCLCVVDDGDKPIPVLSEVEDHVALPPPPDAPPPLPQPAQLPAKDRCRRQSWRPRCRTRPDAQAARPESGPAQPLRPR